MRITPQEYQSRETAIFCCENISNRHSQIFIPALRKTVIFGYAAAQKRPECVDQDLARFLQKCGRHP
jgi:hypothetical protein